MIKYLHHHQIDFSRWNARIESSPQCLIYAYAWYLDIVSPHWQAIVLNDYQAVWPITSIKKWGIPFIAQPLFAQQLGIFGTYTQGEELEMMELLLSKFSYNAHLNLNKNITDTLANAEFNLACVKAKIRYNHLLKLDRAYAEIYLNYTQDRKKNLKKGLKQNWQLAVSQDIEPLITLFDQHHALQIAGGINPKTYSVMRALFAEIQSRNLGKLIYATKDGQIEAGAWFVKSGHRIIYLFNAASTMGRLGNARTVLIDQELRSASKNTLYFDFESPSIDSIDDFYKSFGAETHTFDQLFWNKLPTWIKLLWSIKRKLTSHKR